MPQQNNPKRVQCYSLDSVISWNFSISHLLHVNKARRCGGWCKGKSAGRLYSMSTGESDLFSSGGVHSWGWGRIILFFFFFLICSKQGSDCQVTGMLGGWCAHTEVFSTTSWDIENNCAVCYRNAVYFWCWFFFFFTWTVAYSNNMVSLFFPHDQSREHSVSSVIWQLCSQKRFPIRRFIGDMILKWISKMIWCLCCVFH